jgi:hypothetical protein
VAAEQVAAVVWHARCGDHQASRSAGESPPCSAIFFTPPGVEDSWLGDADQVRGVAVPVLCSDHGVGGRPV